LLLRVKGGHPPLADVQPAPRHLASAEGSEREAAVTVDGDGHAKRQSMGHVMFCALVNSFSIAVLHVNYTC
jgi:hypothetical protein